MRRVSSPARGASSISVSFGIELVPGELPEDGVAIRGERAGFDEHLVAHADGPIERRHHEMQVHGERIHGDDFVRQRAGDVLQALGEILRVVDPRARRGVMARARRAAPIRRVPRSRSRARRAARARANGRTDRSAAAPLACTRQLELLAIRRQDVGGIAVLREVPRDRELRAAARR